MAGLRLEVFKPASQPAVSFKLDRLDRLDCLDSRVYIGVSRGI